VSKYSSLISSAAYDLGCEDTKVFPETKNSDVNEIIPDSIIPWLKKKKKMKDNLNESLLRG